MGKFGYHCTDPSAPLSLQTLDTAFQTAFMTIFATKAYFTQPELTYVLCRPPGHHAGKNTFGGYCYLNNAGLAAQIATKHGQVGLLDIDYHHGNGTQDLFYERADVIYVSLHVDPKIEYPYIHGFETETGYGHGLGCNLNIPLPRNTQNSDYLQALKKAVSFLQAKKVETLILSLSFDFLQGDPLGGFQVTPEIFTDLVQLLQPFPHLILIQEGGYHLARLGEYTQKVLTEFQKTRKDPPHDQEN